MVGRGGEFEAILRAESYGGAGNVVCMSLVCMRL